MSKPVITRLFVGAIVAGLAALVLAFVAVWAAFAGGVFVMDGPDVTGVHNTPGAWTAIGILVLAVLTLITASIAGLIAWIGALLNTAQLDDKAWFLVLLVLGLLSFGFVAMIAYLIAGPDGTRIPAARESMPRSPHPVG